MSHRDDGRSLDITLRYICTFSDDASKGQPDMNLLKNDLKEILQPTFSLVFNFYFLIN